MSLITAHDNKTEITGLTKDNAYHVVNLASYVQTGCVGVLLQFVNNNSVLAKKAGVKGGLAFVDRDFTIKKNSHQIALAKLGVALGLQIKCEDSNVAVFIMAEFFEGMVLRPSDNWVTLSSGTGWKTYTVSLLNDDTYADVEAVIVHGNKDGGTQPFGARAVGTTIEPISLIEKQLFAIPVKTNANGQYQIYIPAAGCGPPTVYGLETGYIKKGYGFTAVLEPEDLLPNTNVNWGNLNLGSTVADYTTHAVMRLVIDDTAGTDTCGVRADGSSNSADILSSATWVVYWPSVNDDKIVEYRYNGDKTVIFDVWGYVVGEAPPEPPEPPVPPPPPVELSISDRFVTSLGPIMLETLNLSNVTGGESITTQLQNPEFGFGVTTSDNFYLTGAISPIISGRNVTINGIDSDKDSDLVLMIFGY